MEIEHIYHNLPTNLFPAAGCYINLILYILQRLGFLRRYELQGLTLPRGLLRNDFLSAFINRHTKGDSFNQLAIPAAFLACDLLSGKDVIFAPRKQPVPHYGKIERSSSSSLTKAWVQR